VHEVQDQGHYATRATDNTIERHPADRHHTGHLQLRICVARSHPNIPSKQIFHDQRFYWGPRWRVDWPEAETHLIAGLKRLTRVNSRDEGVIISLGDNSLFDFPWLYAVEVGSLSLTEYEVHQLREYCLRGGFLMVDDFHGPREWANFAHHMQRVFPDRKIVELSDQAEIFQVLYEVSDRVQIPGLRPLRSGRTWEHGGNIPHWRGILDDEGRVMVAINFNMDLGDAWEHADWPEYPEPYSAMAYRLAVNYVIYAMTH